MSSARDMPVDVRCPDRPRKLFAKLATGRYFEVSCQDCRRKTQGAWPRVVHVLHRYSVETGEFIETVVERAA